MVDVILWRAKHSTQPSEPECFSRAREVTLRRKNLSSLESSANTNLEAHVCWTSTARSAGKDGILALVFRHIEHLHQLRAEDVASFRTYSVDQILASSNPVQGLPLWRKDKVDWCKYILRTDRHTSSCECYRTFEQERLCWWCEFRKTTAKDPITIQRLSRYLWFN